MEYNYRSFYSYCCLFFFFFYFFSVDKLLYMLSQGCILHKVKSGGLLYPRTYYLDTENMVLRYSGSEKRLRKKRISCKIDQQRSNIVLHFQIL